MIRIGIHRRVVVDLAGHLDPAAIEQGRLIVTRPLPMVVVTRLLDEFGKRTGVPVLMNTSFNLRGEAIVYTPTDAVRTFFSSGMDALVIGSFLVEK